MEQAALQRIMRVLLKRVLGAYGDTKRFRVCRHYGYYANMEKQLFFWQMKSKLQSYWIMASSDASNHPPDRNLHMDKMCS